MKGEVGHKDDLPPHPPSKIYLIFRETYFKEAIGSKKVFGMGPNPTELACYHKNRQRMHQKCPSQRRTCEDRVRPHQDTNPGSGLWNREHFCCSGFPACGVLLLQFWLSNSEVRKTELSLIKVWLDNMSYIWKIHTPEFFIFNMYKYRLNLSRHWPMLLC